MSLSDTNLTRLNTELTTDPIIMGYRLSNTNRLLRDLNKPENNVGGELGRVALTRFTVIDIYNQIDSTEFDALAEIQKQLIISIFHKPDIDLKQYRGSIRTAFGNSSVTWGNIQALEVVPLSRAEVLFGADTVVSKRDIARSRKV